MNDFLITETVEISTKNHGITMRVKYLKDHIDMITTSFVDSEGEDYCVQNLTIIEARELGKILTKMTQNGE